MTTTHERADEADVFRIERPEGIRDAQWEALKIATHRVMTGHYPWCTDHEAHGDDSDNWCQTAVDSGGGLVTMSTGTKSGLPLIWVNSPEGRAGSMEDLTTAEAWQLGSTLMALADAAEKAPFRKALAK